MRLVPFKQVKSAAGDPRIIRESEFAKPYGEQYEEPWEDFSAMEYEAPNLPPWGWDYPDMADPKSTYRVVFLCGGEDFCYCKEESVAFDGKCSWEIIGAEFKPAWNEVGVSYNKRNVFFFGLDTATGCGTLTITMKATFKVGKKTQTVVGTHGGILVCECSEAECEEACIDDTGIAWDSVNSPQTIARNNNATVYITDSLGTGGPYSWSVSGSGTWSLDDTDTVGLTNTLNCGSDACGTATITVTGCDGFEVTGYVRCTTGGWTAQTNICGPGSNPGCGLNSWCTKTNDYYERQFVCGCCIDCQPTAPHPCPYEGGCVPQSSWWNTHCSASYCHSVCIHPQYVTHHWTLERVWQC